MLLTNRRVSLVFFCLAGMEVAWFTPFWLLVYRPARASVGWAYLLLLAALVAWTLVLELLSRTDLELGRYHLTALGLMAFTSLVLLGVALFWNHPSGDMRWLGPAFNALFVPQSGLPPALALVGGNLFLWQRATVATSRDVTFFGVGVNFRLGLLLLVVGGGIFSYVSGQNLTWLLWIYFTLGLLAVAIARIHEKAGDSQSAGTPLSGRRLGGLLVAVAATVGGVALLSGGYTAQAIWRALSITAPVWRLLRIVLVRVLIALEWLLEPILEWLLAWLQRIFAAGWIELAPQSPIVGAEEAQQMLTQENPSRFLELLRQAGIVLAIGAGVVLGVAILLLYLDKTRRRTVREQAEEAEAEAVTFGSGILGRGAQALRDMAGLVRRFGVSRQLLAAVSVQNIYANLCRLARRRGYGRRPAQPPDDYLPTLARAFSGQEEALARITAAYMRVHYGERPVTFAELAQLRADYHQVRRAERSESAE